MDFCSSFVRKEDINNRIIKKGVFAFLLGHIFYIWELQIKSFFLKTKVLFKYVYGNVEVRPRLKRRKYDVYCVCPSWPSEIFSRYAVVWKFFATKWMFWQSIRTGLLSGTKARQ